MRTWSKNVQIIRIIIPMMKMNATGDLLGFSSINTHVCGNPNNFTMKVLSNSFELNPTGGVGVNTNLNDRKNPNSNPTVGKRSPIALRRFMFIRHASGTDGFRFPTR
mmetsp:Transcript_10002/g.11535  ORF Transcript_10002/g.11535 Transcript_10002/m.11535 type:complete len:107 (-) Transcript_10002:132-452(-)